jgi:hypothetical protein
MHPSVNSVGKQRQVECGLSRHQMTVVRCSYYPDTGSFRCTCDSLMIADFCGGHVPAGIGCPQPRRRTSFQCCAVVPWQCPQSVTGHLRGQIALQLIQPDTACALESSVIDA